MLSSPPEGFRFDKTHLPHITLVQQFVQADQLAAFSQKIGSLVCNNKTLALETLEIVHGQRCSILKISRIPALIQLHQRLMNGLRHFEAADGTLESFISDSESPSAADLEWVKNYRKQAAYKNFDPHITIGVGNILETPTPRRFLVNQLALFQLGRYCTCRRRIEQWSLTRQKE
jgi:hypothetical protein